MNQTYLEENLARFKAAAGAKIEDCRLELLFQGFELSSPYVLKVLAPWTKDVSSFEGYGALYRIALESMDRDALKRIFTMDVATTPEAFARPFRNPAAYESPLG